MLHKCSGTCKEAIRKGEDLKTSPNTLTTESMSSLLYKIGSLAPIITWFFQCLGEWVKGTTEQYVLMGVVSPFDGYFSSVTIHSYWIPFWFFHPSWFSSLCAKIVFFQRCFQKCFCSDLMGSVFNVWAEIEEVLYEKWAHLNGEVSCEQKYCIVLLWSS